MTNEGEAWENLLGKNREKEREKEKENRKRNHAMLILKCLHNWFWNNYPRM